MTPEARVKHKVREILKQFGCYYFSPLTGGYGTSGVPDIVGCYRGYFFAIECKAGKGKPTDLQLKNIVSIIENGGRAWVVNEHNIVDVRTLLKGIDDAVIHSEGRAGTRGRAADNDSSQAGNKARDVGQEDNVGDRDKRPARQSKRIRAV